MASGKAPRRIIFTFCNLLREEKRKPNTTIRQMAARRAKGSSNEYQTMIWLGEKWSMCKAQNEFYVNVAVFLEKRLQDLHAFIYPALIQDEKANICSCCTSIIRRSRRAKAIQNARFGFMFITARYAPEMKSDQMCLFDIFVYFGSATQKLCHIFRLFRLRFQLRV